MSDLPDEIRVRRQRAHAVASFLGMRYMDGLRVDPEALAICAALRRRRDIGRQDDVCHIAGLPLHA
jgi:hypothetical protein